MFWTDGSIYKGEWRRGIQHGKGVMTFSDGTIKEGYFENNVYRGTMPPIDDTIIEEVNEEMQGTIH